MIRKVNQSFISIQENYPIYIKDYIEYIIDLLSNILLHDDSIKVHIIFGEDSSKSLTHLPSIHIGYNIEHTLVKEGGRDISPHTIYGKIPINNNNQNTSFYFIRLNDEEKMLNKNIMIDYSIPNIENIHSHEKYKELYQKMCYVSPMIFSDFNFQKENRDIPLLTSFIHIHEPRRFHLLNELKKHHLQNHNIHSVFDKNELKKILCKTKIIINIHQTDYHHTFEELRCLPALLCGTLIISEYSPLSELIPYKDYIIWTSYEDMIPTIKDVLQNYDSYHQKIFHPDSYSFFKDLHLKNETILKEKIKLYL